MQLTGCPASPSRVCRQSIILEVLDIAERIHDSLCSFVDALGKAAAGEADVLCVSESEGGAPKLRNFGILASATFKPNWQVWVPCAWSSANEGRPSDADSAFPCEVDIETEPCKVTLSGTSIKALASFELAVMLAQSGDRWRVAQLRYDIPDKESLVTSRLLGIEGDWRSLVSERTGASRSRSAPVAQANPALAALAGLPRSSAVALGERRAAQGPRPAAARAPLALMASRPAELAEDHADEGVDEFLPDEIALDVLDLTGLADPPPQISDTMGDEDLTEAVAVVDLSGPPSASSGAAADPPPAPPAPEAPPPDAVLLGPDRNGYFKRNGSSVARITATFKNSRGVKCDLHSKCTLAIGLNHFLTDEEVREWACQGEQILPGDSQAEQNRKRDKHFAALQRLRDTRKVVAKK